MKKTYNTHTLISSGNNPKFELKATQTLLGGKPAGIKIVIQEIDICKHCEHWTKHIIYSSDVVGCKEIIDIQWCIKYLDQWREERKV